MRTSVQRLRWILAGGAVLLLVVLVAFVSYGRYRALRAWHDILNRSGVHITHETDGFTYSQSLGGRTIFTLHAARAIQHDNGIYTLQDVVITLYGKTGNSVDHVSGSNFEYDPKAGIVRAFGEVLMDIEPPGAPSSGGPHASGSAPPTEAANHVIYVRTSGLIFLHKLSVAATSQPVEFRYAGMKCTAVGAEFDSGESKLRLLADVQLTGTVRGQPTVIRAANAILDRSADVVTLAEPQVVSQQRTAKAATAVLQLRPDGSISAVSATGGVALDAGTRHIAAASFAGTFSPAGHPQSARLTGGVVLTDSDRTRPLQGSAAEVDATFDESGAPTGLVATGAAQFLLSDRSLSGPPLTRELQGDSITAKLQPVEGRQTASRLTELLVTGHAMARGNSLATPSAAHGNAHGSMQDAALRSTTVSADSLRAVFVPGAASSASPKGSSNHASKTAPNPATNEIQRAHLSRLFGEGNTRLEQDAPRGEQQTSTADSLAIVFAPSAAGKAVAGQAAAGQAADGKTPTGQATLQIASATQTGHVRIYSHPAEPVGKTAAQAPSDATAERAAYDGATKRLRLTGAAHFTEGQTALTASSITLDQSTGDAEAAGSILATLLPAASPAPASAHVALSSTAAATHISAMRAHLSRSAERAEFRGTDAHPARLWQGASQVEAASLFFDQKQRTLLARPASPGGQIHAVFAGTPASKTAPSASTGHHGSRNSDTATAQIVRVTSAAMSYSDLASEATFTGSVRIDGSTGDARSERAEVFLHASPPASIYGPRPTHVLPGTAANPFSGSLQRIVLSGDVHLEQPGREGMGEQLVYTAADSTFLLTGTPSRLPHIVDAQQGSITGAKLLFRQGDSAIVVTGAPASRPGGKPTRVRTETGVNP